MRLWLQLSEDIENMSKELVYWQNERIQYARRLEEERRATEAAVQQKGAFDELDEQIKGMTEKIESVRAQVFRNDDTISKLLSMVAVGSK